MPQSTLSRRISEFLGVALFALALIWLIALVTYEPTDPVWFFTTDAVHPPANFVGRVGAFLSELSFQLLGYGAYLIPAAMTRPTKPTAPSTTSPIVISRVTGGWRTVCTMIAPDWEPGDGVLWGVGAGAGAGC